MAKFLKRDAVTGRTAEELTAETSAGVGDAGKVPNLNAAGVLDPSLLPPGVGANSAEVEASETIAIGQLVEIFDDAGTPKARLADATAGNNFTAVAWAATAGNATDTITVYFEGRVTPAGGGLTPGQRLYLSETPGSVTSTPVTTAGAFHQFIGKAVSATQYNFEPDDPILLA